MISKKRILVFVGYYLPGYKAGGPIRTIANMVDLLSDEFEFYIVTGDRDSMDTRPYPHLKNTTEWQQVGKAQVLYLSPSERSFSNLRRVIRETPHEYLYLNSFFSFQFTIKPLILKRLRLVSSKKIVLAPRGEFSTGALGLKAFKKQLFLIVSRAFGLYKDIVWQASSCYEADDIKKSLPAIAFEVHEAVDLPDITYLNQKNRFIPKKTKEPLKAVFVSRISPKKNLDYALDLLKKVKVEVVYDIVGAANDGVYYQKCLDIAKKLPANIKVNFRGVMEHSEVVAKFSEYDLFFFPTKGENFGHVILEALSAGTPALIANTTPWMDLEENNAGWVFSLDDSDKFVEIIELMATLPVEEQQTQREAVRAYAKKHLFNQENIEQNKLLFS